MEGEAPRRLEVMSKDPIPIRPSLDPRSSDPLGFLLVFLLFSLLFLFFLHLNREEFIFPTSKSTVRFLLARSCVCVV